MSMRETAMPETAMPETAMRASSLRESSIRKTSIRKTSIRDSWAAWRRGPLLSGLLDARPPGEGAGGRDARLDMFRGLALIMIFVNHVPGTIYETYTSRNFGFSDAAEAFVFMSGMAAGLAYSGRFRTGPLFHFPALGAHRAVHVGADELVVFDAAAVAIEGHAHAFARAVADQ